MRYLQTVFCDDIRHEVAGKLSYIGVYGPQLFVPSFPITLPKLCLTVRVVTPAAQPFRVLTFRILKGDTQLAEATLEDADLASVADAIGSSSTDEHANRMQVLEAIFVFSPFLIDEPCSLRVQATTEAGDLRGLGLKIEQTPSGAAASH
ncbi:MAG: hypothetical protein F9K47_06940 [Burkholderiales bacterium]|nr:MAG: hypothetical protein F9K47_06940 [Burkholderiales bacterium]